MKNIFILGSQGYNKNYGGWETFVKNFCNYYDKTKTNLYVTELSHEKNKDIYVNNGINCVPVYTKNIGNATMFLNAILSFVFIKKYIQKNKIENAIIYILGLRLGPILFFYKNYFKKRNIKIYINPDGLEWKRSKWNKFIKFCFKYSEKTMTKNCDRIICDSKNIKKYLEEEYPNIMTPKSYIAYGTKKIDLENVDEKYLLKAYSLAKDDYYLIVARFVPENNFSLIIKEFVKSSTNKKLVIISNYENNKYYDILNTETNFISDNRIQFIPGVYDEIKLSTIRKNAFAYIHGHSVGGTNPSLLEALSLTDLNILYNVGFNSEVGQESCLYFKDENSLTKIINDEKELMTIKKEKGKLAKEIIKKNYTWEYIIEEYKKIFNNEE